MIHLDTNFLIQATIAGSTAHGQIRAWAAIPEDLGVSTIAWAEFMCGPLDSAATVLAARIFSNPEPFLVRDAILSAALFNQTGRRSRSLADCMIGAVAIRCGAKLATVNAADFRPFLPFGLILAD
jgi:predicted nucleic acid-binding protein